MKIIRLITTVTLFKVNDKDKKGPNDSKTTRKLSKINPFN